MLVLTKEDVFLNAHLKLREVERYGINFDFAKWDVLSCVWLGLQVAGSGYNGARLSVAQENRINQSVDRSPVICKVQDHFYSTYLLMLEVYSTGTFMQLMTKILMILSWCAIYMNWNFLWARTFLLH